MSQVGIFTARPGSVTLAIGGGRGTGGDPPTPARASGIPSGGPALTFPSPRHYVNRDIDRDASGSITRTTQGEYETHEEG